MMEQFIMKPDVTFYYGVRVNKDTKLDYKTDGIEQKVDNLVLKSKTTIKTEEYESTYNTKVKLNEGDILIFEEEGRGYIKPVQEMYTVEQAIEELNLIK